MRTRKMEYSTQRSLWFHGASLIYILLAVTVGSSIDVTLHEEPSNLVSIEDSIDVDGGPSAQVLTDKNRGHTVDIQIHALPKHNTKTVFRDSFYDDDDEDTLTSGSGSGSGDNHLLVVAGESNGNMTPTHAQLTITTTLEPLANSTHKVDNKGNSTQANMTIDIDHTNVDNDNDESNDIIEEDADVIYDLPATSSSLISNNVLSAPTWSKWSDWFLASSTSKLRVRNCEVDSEEVNVAACDGVRMQMRSCDKNNPNQCGKIQEIKTFSLDRCEETMKNKQQQMLLKAPSVVATPTKATPATPAKKTSLDMCRYSLYDTYRQKYVFSGWNLTELISKSKVKRWCDKSSGQYLVLTTPKDHCRQYYKDLCQLSGKCRSDRPTKERGDFAEGCWRNLVYGDMLPVGLSNKQTIVYFICQRFAAESKLGKIFGYKETYFGTLYNTNTRSPTLSLNKITRLGDETWPDTHFFIEHGLVEMESDALWLFRKPKKGVLSLQDLERCSDDESCELGLRQILPQDYVDSIKSGYTPTHLMWPELMPPDPDPKLATFTLTNIAPLQTSLFEEWHKTIIKVRHYAIEQCGIPVFLDSTFSHQTDFSTHRSNKSAMYVASGVLPSSGPPVTTGRDIHVPFLFWIAGCCVKQRSTFAVNLEYDNDNVSNFTEGTWSESYIGEETTNVTAFSLYIINSIGNHVIPAPVLQLEMLLQDIYKSMSSDPDVTLFPGYGSTCSDLKNDASIWFQI